MDGEIVERIMRQEAEQKVAPILMRDSLRRIETILIEIRDLLKADHGDSDGS